MKSSTRLTQGVRRAGNAALTAILGLLGISVKQDPKPQPPVCHRCGLGEVDGLGLLVQTATGLEHWRCIPTYIRHDELALSRYLAAAEN